jgi:hypothetical protein
MTAAPGSYVGLRYNRPPAGLEEATGVLIDSLDGTAYSLSWMKGRGGDMLWLNRQVGEEAGHPRWQVIAQLPIPTHAEGEQFVVGLCWRNGRRDSELSAVVLTEDTERYRTVRRVWRADRHAGRFEVASPAGVECENEGHGVD